MSLFRFLGILFRERPTKMKLESICRVTLNLDKLVAAIPSGGAATKSVADANNWLMRMGCTPTGNPSVWKVPQSQVGRIPKSAMIKTEVLK